MTDWQDTPCEDVREATKGKKLSEDTCFYDENPAKHMLRFYNELEEDMPVFDFVVAPGDWFPLLLCEDHYNQISSQGDK